jgi:hypothetical protein
VIKEDEMVVGVLTGHLLKDTDYVMKYHSETLIGPDGKEIRGSFVNRTISRQDFQDLRDLQD